MFETKWINSIKYLLYFHIYTKAIKQSKQAAYCTCDLTAGESDCYYNQTEGSNDKI